ncbi:MAG: hypothetical protein HC893_07030 [Chloroflexaceae bacterium]|nr:hypothetical protein [Chloroflexaceae bacterium]
MLPNLNRPTLASTTGPLLRVVTHNKLYFTDDTQALARVLLAQDADIIGLQELTGNDKQALDTLLAEHYPYRALDNDGPLGSLGLLSRFPIVSEARVPGISAAHFLLDVYGQPIHVINLHAPVPETGLDRTGMLGRFVPRPTYDATRRDAQLTALVDYTGGIQGPLIMIGDFNLSDREPFYDILNNPLHDSFDEAGWGAGFSFPNLQHRSAGVLIDYLLDVVGIGDRIAFASAPLPQLPPLVRIDYIWTNDALVPLSSRLRCEELDSDHCMLISDVGLLSRT